jgi:hypothetical protein
MLDQVTARRQSFDVLRFQLDFFHYLPFRGMAHNGPQVLPAWPAFIVLCPYAPCLDLRSPAWTGAARALYPVACPTQDWAWQVAFALLQASLGWS